VEPPRNVCGSLKVKVVHLQDRAFTFFMQGFIMFSVITNIYNKKTKGPILMELFTAAGKLKKFFFYN
jgi:hypothetical protein